MTEQQIAEFLRGAAERAAENEERNITVERFDYLGQVNQGFVLRLGNPGGPEFSVMVVRSL